MCPLLVMISTCELFPCVVKLPAAPLEKKILSKQCNLGQMRRMESHHEHETLLLYSSLLLWPTVCLQVCRLALVCLCVRWWAGVREHVGDTLVFSQFLVFSCKPLLSAMWHLCASTPAICINSGAAGPSKNTHTCTPTALLLSPQRGLRRLLFGYWLFVV